MEELEEALPPPPTRPARDKASRDSRRNLLQQDTAEEVAEAAPLALGPPRKRRAVEAGPSQPTSPAGQAAAGGAGKAGGDEQPSKPLRSGSLGGSGAGRSARMRRVKSAADKNELELTGLTLTGLQSAMTVVPVVSVSSRKPVISAVLPSGQPGIRSPGGSHLPLSVPTFSRGRHAHDSQRGEAPSNLPPCTGQMKGACGGVRE